MAPVQHLYRRGAEWPTVYLGDVAKIQTGKSNKEDAVSGGEYPLFDRSPHAQQSMRYLFDKEAIIIPGEGKEFPPRYFSGKFDLHQRVYAITDFAGVDGRFLYYMMAYKKQYFAQVAIGATVKSLRKWMFERFSFGCPPLTEQERIASILSAYDDLIDNNRKRITLLEKAARLLYREWFVHLRFPGHERTTIIEGVPEGWEQYALSDLADFMNGYAFKPAQLGTVGLPIVKIPELKQGVTGKTPRNSGDQVPTKYRLKNGDLLFSWSGTLAVNAWSGGDALLNQHLFLVSPTGSVGNGVLLCALRDTLNTFDSHTVGATMKHIRRSALDKVFVTLPSGSLLNEGNTKLDSIYNQLVALNRWNHTLAKARDLLLPRLITGQLGV